MELSLGIKDPVPLVIHIPVLAPPVTEPLKNATSSLQMDRSLPALTAGIAVLVTIIVSDSEEQLPLFVEFRKIVSTLKILSG